MKLWDVKAQALRMMFSDSDLDFTIEEFEDGTINNNSNTKDKLVRMDASINRAIDDFFDYCGDFRKKVEVNLIEYVILEDGTEVDNPSEEQKEEFTVYYRNYINLSSITDMKSPARIDLEQDYENRIFGIENIDFYYSTLDTTIYIKGINTSVFTSNPTFTLYYITNRLYLSGSESDITFDLDDLNIPRDVQNKIPLFIKGELYEEDEPTMAQLSRDLYTRFLYGRTKNFSMVQKKITRAKVFNKR